MLTEMIGVRMLGWRSQREQNYSNHQRVESWWGQDRGGSLEPGDGAAVGRVDKSVGVTCHQRGTLRENRNV